MDQDNEEYIYEEPSEVKLLIVDDRPDNLFSIETILEPDGYNIKTANSGRAALRTLLKEDDFTLILMDVQMPDLNGFETATLIFERDKLKHIPIIFITANDYGEESVFKGYKMGAVDYIYKPINPNLLRAKVAVCVELFKKNHQLIAQEQKLKNANRILEKEIMERKLSENKVRMLNIELIENIRQLKTTNEELERFAYVASHDLQEPLRKIILFSDLLGKKHKPNLEDDAKDFIDRIIKSSLRMQMLIKNILVYSRSSTGADLFEETDLNALLADVLSDLEISIEQKSAVVNIQPLPVAHVMPGQIRQVFQNLIINSLKFAKPDCKPEINIHAKISKGESIPGVKKHYYAATYLSIYISDNGIGFEQKYANDIFVLFKRLNNYQEHEGSGIGLSICKKIVEKHNGTISATSALGEGATFVISLPLKQLAET